jgi:hypothetical protein
VELTACQIKPIATSGTTRPTGDHNTA